MPGSTRPRAPRPRILTALLAFAISLVVAGCAGGPDPSTGGSGSLGAASPGATPKQTPKPLATMKPRPSPTADPALAGVPVRTVPAEFIDIGVPVGYMAVAGDYLWAATDKGLLRIDPNDLSITELDHALRFGMAASADSVWVTKYEGLAIRYDPKTLLQTASISLLGNPNTMTIDGNSVWVAQHHGGAVTRLREPSGEIVTEVKVGSGGQSGPQGIAVDGTSLWTGLPNDSIVVRVDTSTNAVIAKIPVTKSPCGGIAIEPDAVWVSSCYDDHFVIRIDALKNTLVAEIDIGGHNGGALLANGRVWIPTDIGLVLVARETNAIERVVTFTEDRFEAFGSAVGFGYAWIGSVDGSGIARIALSDLAD
jgi:YVTN family beta-propeller protein